MKLHVLAVGHRMPGWIAAGLEEYAKRMPPELRLELHEIKAEQRGLGRTAETAMAAERQRIEAALPKGAALIALDERGQDWTTVKLAQAMQRWRLTGTDLAFVIGGADGLDPVLKARAGTLLRLSSLTLPHALARVLLAEQLYRAWTLIRNHPYHRL